MKLSIQNKPLSLLKPAMAVIRPVLLKESKKTGKKENSFVSSVMFCM